MRAQEFVDEDLTRRGFLRGMGAAAAAGATGGALAQAQPVDASKEFQNMRRDDPRVRHAQDINDLAKAIYQNMVAERGQPADRREQNKWMEIAHLKAEARFAQYKPGAQTATKPTAGFSSQGSEYRRARDIDNFESVTERKKSRRKKSSRHGGYFFPGYGYYSGGGDGGEGGGDGGGESRSGMAEGNDKEQAVRRIQKMLNDRFDANLDIDGVMGPLTQKSINRFMPRARPGAADEPNKTTAVQGKTVKDHNVSEEQLDELSFLGSECTKDCSGHRAGYDWSKRKGLRQANSWSPSFNKGAGLAVAGK